MIIHAYGHLTIEFPQLHSERGGRMRIRRSILSVSLFVLLLFALLSPAHAKNPDLYFDLSNFHPPVDQYGFGSLETSRIYEPWRLGFGLDLHFVQKPLEVNRLGSDGKRHAEDLIGSRVKMDLTLAMSFCKYYEMGFDIPWLAFQDGAAEAYLGADSAAFGDIRWHHKIRALDRKEFPVGLAAVVTLVLPSGEQKSLMGDRETGAEFKLVLDAEIEPVIIALNLGYRIRDEINVFTIRSYDGKKLFSQQIDDELLYALGIEYKTPLDGLSLITDFRGSVLAEKPFDQRFNSPVIWDLGARYFAPYGIVASAGFEVGLNAGYGAGKGGFFANLGWMWEKFDRDSDGLDDNKDKCPEAAEDKDEFEDLDGCPDQDNDMDGIPDVMDKCPNNPEDFDDYQDDDGCGEPDNDLDGIPDGKDLCPLAAEDFDGDRDEDGCPDYDTDKDGIDDFADKCPMETEDKDDFEDKDGCPDLDNDADGVPDAKDKCPNDPEDKDGFEDEDGCPDPDNDHDGTLDADDRCPLEAETINGFEDYDGCPDKGEVIVLYKTNHLELKKPIEFEPEMALLKGGSASILEQVALTLKAHPGYEKIIIGVHLDNKGDAKKNQELTQSRANVIRGFLLSRGIDEKKLEAKGFGSGEPIASNTTAKGREKNRRVEFQIVGGAKPAPVEEGLPELQLVPLPR